MRGPTFLRVRPAVEQLPRKICSRGRELLHHVSARPLRKPGDAALSARQARAALSNGNARDRKRMGYPEQYRAEVLNAIQGLDLDRVSGAIDVLREARARGRCIFVCGSGKNASAAGRLLCEMVRGIESEPVDALPHRGLSDELTHTRGPDW